MDYKEMQDFKRYARLLIAMNLIIQSTIINQIYFSKRYLLTETLILKLFKVIPETKVLNQFSSFLFVIWIFEFLKIKYILILNRPS